jgi:D-alanyl-D-alanine carboxypeptidase/D-alanyl-D-alanine-endopeptidase (penicillin-binding protein 4)
VTVTPDNDYVEVVNQATTTEAGSGRSISIERPLGENRVVASGTVATDGSALSVWRSVWEPTPYAVDVFKNALEDAGVRVLGRLRTGTTPDDADVIAEHSSMPLSQMMVPFMKLSNNGHAEVLIKTLGAEYGTSATWSAGVDVAREHLKSEYGLDTSTFSTRDGSGLSRRNWIPSAEIITLLDEVQAESWFDEWYESLPIAGNPERFVGGTLRSRMQDTPAENNAHAKTGSLTGATALSGYVDDADGERLLFSIMMNDYLSGKPSDLEDAIVVRLAEFSDSEDGGASLRTRSVPTPRDLPDDVECTWIKDENGDAC